MTTAKAFLNSTFQANVEEGKVLIFPVHLKSFWCLYVIMPKPKKIPFFSPLGEECEVCLSVSIKECSRL